MESEELIRTAVHEAFKDQLRAMQNADTHHLAAILDDGFTLTHITGYRQPKSEWLSQMQAGQFQYHSISERSVDIKVHADTVSLVGRVITDATIYGSRSSWRLQLALEYVRRGDTWIALRSVATTW